MNTCVTVGVPMVDVVNQEPFMTRYVIQWRTQRENGDSQEGGMERATQGHGDG